MENKNFEKSLIKIITAVLNIKQSITSDKSQKEKIIIEKILEELSILLGFSAWVCIPFKGDLLDPPSISLDISEFNQPIIKNIKPDFIANYWGIIKTVIDKYDTEVALDFITSDFSDRAGHISAGDIDSHKMELVDKFGVAEIYAQRTLELFEQNSIGHWALRADAYKDGFYVTSAYRKKHEKKYSEEETAFFSALLPFLYRACDISIKGWGGVWVALISCDEELKLLFDSFIEEHNFYYGFLNAIKDDKESMIGFINDYANKSAYKLFYGGIDFLAVKLQHPNILDCLPVIAVTGNYDLDSKTSSIVYPEHSIY